MLCVILNRQQRVPGRHISLRSDSDFQASPERLDPQKSYLLDNTVLIPVCVEFNGTCNHRKGDKAKVEINSQWTKAKADEWLVWLESSEGRDYLSRKCAVPSQEGD